MKYTWKNGAWRDSEGNAMELPKGDVIAMPHIQSDYPAYYSHGSGKMIEGRAAHREDLKRTGCRLMEPDEGPKYATTEKWAKKLGLEHNPQGGRPKHWPDYYSGKRIESKPEVTDA